MPVSSGYITYMKTESPDALLVAQAAGGSEQAFEMLVNRYSTPLFHFIRQHLHDYEQALDVLQHVFCQLYRSIPKLHNHLDSRRTREPLKAWLFQVAANRCIDERRKKRPVLFSELEQSDKDDDWSLLEQLSDPEPLPEQISEQHDLQRRLYQAIEQLPPRFREIVFLRYTREWSFVEIGHQLNIPENTAKTYFQRARPLLRTALRSDMLVHS